MSLIDDIKRDRESGTPGKFIADFDGEDDFYGVPIMSEHRGKSFVPVANCPVYCNDRDQSIADASRIARVPDIEALLLAADEVAMWVEECIERKFHAAPLSYLEEAIAAYREATK